MSKAVKDVADSAFNTLNALLGRLDSIHDVTATDTTALKALRKAVLKARDAALDARELLEGPHTL